MRRVLGSVVVVLLVLGGVRLWTQSAAPAPTLRTMKALPAAWSVEAAMAAVDDCRAKGQNVSASVVGADGIRQVVIRGDGASPHTVENSFNKGYTMITLGPIQKKDSTGEIAAAMTRSPATSTTMPAASLPGLTFTPGGVAVKVDGVIIAGLGVSGAPSGDIDEGCARAGLAKIEAHLKQ
ncbi:MAG TPA: heme-binding protein [Terriglobales bacterium]|nr:heme-binding protein [Terriglobales bacterium]